ncbi:hypothetical protein, partial [Erythrobacter sp. HI0019]|uniref:hypothetical protein n=1 Tax=Erythrobacter sp. HI0019 TaxID=1822222 RepID=UPI001F3C43E7
NPSKRASQREAAIGLQRLPRPRLGSFFQTSLFTRVVSNPATAPGFRHGTLSAPHYECEFS